MHVGQPEITTEMVPGELSVVEAEQMQHRGMQIVNVNLAGDHTVAQVIGLAVG